MTPRRRAHLAFAADDASPVEMHGALLDARSSRGRSAQRTRTKKTKTWSETRFREVPPMRPLSSRKPARTRFAVWHVAACSLGRCPEVARRWGNNLLLLPLLLPFLFWEKHLRGVDETKRQSWSQHPLPSAARRRMAAARQQGGPLGKPTPKARTLRYRRTATPALVARSTCRPGPRPGLPGCRRPFPLGALLVPLSPGCSATQSPLQPCFMLSNALS